MKTALKIGFSTTTQYWKSTLLHSRFLIFTFILITLLESFLLYEVIRIVGFLSLDYNSISIFSVDVLDLSDNANSLASYLSNLSRNFFYELLLLNSFFLGVYYHHAGFPEQSETQPRIDTILDVPIDGNRRPTLGLVLQYIEKENRTYYFKIVLLFIVAQILGGMIGDVLYRIFTFAGHVYYWLFQLLPYLLLLLLYLKWLDIPFSKFRENKEKWLVVIICGILVPNMGWYLLSVINSIVNIVTYAFSSFTEVGKLLRFFAMVACYMLMVPFISIFYSQTLIYFKNEQEA
jgi:hypothetical protein